MWVDVDSAFLPYRPPQGEQGCGSPEPGQCPALVWTQPGCCGLAETGSGDITQQRDNTLHVGQRVCCEFGDAWCVWGVWGVLCVCGAPNNFLDFNFAKGGLQQQTYTVCIHIFTFIFSRSPVDLRNSRK